MITGLWKKRWIEVSAAGICYKSRLVVVKIISPLMSGKGKNYYLCVRESFSVI